MKANRVVSIDMVDEKSNATFNPGREKFSNVRVTEHNDSDHS